jgi:hypothetical protein
MRILDLENRIVASIEEVFDRIQSQVKVSLCLLSISNEGLFQSQVKVSGFNVKLRPLCVWLHRVLTRVAP